MNEFIRGVLIGLGGAAVGALLTALFVLAFQRRERRILARAAARAVLCEMIDNARAAEAFARSLNPHSSLELHELFALSTWRDHLALLAPLLSWEALGKTRRAYESALPAYRSVAFYLAKANASAPTSSSELTAVELAPSTLNRNDSINPEDQAREALVGVVENFVEAIEAWPLETLLSNSDRRELVSRLTQLKKAIRAHQLALRAGRRPGRRVFRFPVLGKIFRRA